MLKKWLCVLGLLMCFSALAEPKVILKISILSSNEVLLNGQPVQPADLVEAISNAQEKKGRIWYFRENVTKDRPSKIAKKVIGLLVQSKLPISLSTKSDFSDYVDAKGHVMPRFLF